MAKIIYELYKLLIILNYELIGMMAYHMLYIWYVYK